MDEELAELAELACLAREASADAGLGSAWDEFAKWGKDQLKSGATELTKAGISRAADAVRGGPAPGTPGYGGVNLPPIQTESTFLGMPAPVALAGAAIVGLGLLLALRKR